MPSSVSRPVMRSSRGTALLSRVSLALVGAVLLLIAGPAGADASTKRGYAAGSGLTNSTQYASLNAVWYYNWGLHASPQISGIPFTPMYWDARCLYDPNNTQYCHGAPATGATDLLGFNEPDLSVQSNMTVEQALAAWPLLVAEAKRLGYAEIGAPAMAKDPVTTPWLPEFMASANASVDFVTLHWYKGINATLFISDVRALIDFYGKPVWVTEFNPRSSDHEDPFLYSYEQVQAFLEVVLTFMENEAMVHRYAMFDGIYGSGALFFPENGTLTPTGAFYANFEAVKPMVPASSAPIYVVSFLGGGMVLFFGVFIGLDIRRRMRLAAEGQGYVAI